jgi:signal transduction histidine kinase
VKTTFLLIVCALAALHEVKGQPAIKDSLENLLKREISTTAKVDVLNLLAYQYYDYNDSIASNYAHNALSLAKKIRYSKGLKYAYTMVGLGFSSKSKFKKAIGYFLSSDKIKGQPNDATTAYNLSLLGNCYRDMGKYDSAFITYNKAIKNNHKSWEIYSAIYKNMAIVNLILWRNKEAIVLADSAQKYLNRDKNTDQYVRLDLWSIYGQAYKNILQFDRSLSYYDSICVASTQFEDFYHQIMCELSKGELEYEKGNYSTALLFCFKALELTKKYAYPPQYVKVLIQIGEIYSELAHYDIASQYFHKALRVTEELGLQAETALIYSELGWIEKDLGDFKNALIYCNKSMEIRTAIGDRKGVSNCHNLFGLIYLLQKKYLKSIGELEKALAIRKDIDFQVGVSASIFNLALVYEKLDQIDKAIEYYKQAVELEKPLSTKQSIAISYNTIGRILVNSGKLDEAYSYLTKAKLISDYSDSYLLKRNNAQEFANYYRAKNEYRKAFEYQLIFQQWNDSVYSEKSAIKLAESKAIYNVEMKEMDIMLLKQTQDAQRNQLSLQEAELSRKNWVITLTIIGAVMLAIGGIIILLLYREKTRTNRELKDQQEEIQAQSEELQEANQQIANINKTLEAKVETRTSELRQAFKELDTFFYRSSHDFRRPITTFLGLAGVAKITLKDPVALELFDKVAETATSLDKMLQKLASISDVGTNQMIFKEVFLVDQINEVIDGFDKILREKNITLHKEVEYSISFVSYPAMIKIILENVIENAIHFAGTDHPRISIRALVNPTITLIEVEDNGQGIQEEHKPRVFEMYFRANERSKGNGLGLYIAKKAVEKLNGKIWFQSNYRVGTTFTIEIPNIR